MSVVQTIFYISGAIFFILCIIAVVIFIFQANRTAKSIQKVLSRPELESIISNIKDGINPILQHLSRR